MAKLSGMVRIGILFASLVGISGCNSSELFGLSENSGFKPLPLVEMRFSNTIRQRLDFSCGAAAVATILTFYYQDDTSEEDVLSALQRLPNLVNWKKKAAEGFSFSDLIFAAGEFGYAAQGASIDLSQLDKISGPVIVHLDKGSFQHFVVLRQMGDGVAYVSDPIVGATNMSMIEFTEQYTGYALAVWKLNENQPEKSPLEAVKDGTSVSDVVGTQLYRIQTLNHPSF